MVVSKTKHVSKLHILCLITVTFSDNSTRIYPVSKSGSGGQSVSGSFELPKKAKTAGISGVAYGPGGIQISIPTID